MEEILQSEATRYNREALIHYVQMRISTAKIEKHGDPNSLTRITIRNWVRAFKAKYDV
jgi:hypothetical protein